MLLHGLLQILSFLISQVANNRREAENISGATNKTFSSIASDVQEFKKDTLNSGAVIPMLHTKESKLQIRLMSGRTQCCTVPFPVNTMGQCVQRLKVFVPHSHTHSQNLTSVSFWPAAHFKQNVSIQCHVCFEVNI